MKTLFLFRHQWLLVAAVYFISGFFIEPLDLATHDTYFVIDGKHVGIAGALLFLLLWALHRFVKAFRTVRWLSAIHSIGTSLSGLAILLFLVMAATQSEPKPYTDYSVYAEFNNPAISATDWLTFLILAFLFLQLIWIVQLAARLMTPPES